jgi:hypothetical protein
VYQNCRDCVWHLFDNKVFVNKNQSKIIYFNVIL